MNWFSYISVGLVVFLFLLWFILGVVDMLKDSLGRAIVFGYAAIIAAVCAVVGAVWLIGTKVL